MSPTPTHVIIRSDEIGQEQAQRVKTKFDAWVKEGGSILINEWADVYVLTDGHWHALPRYEEPIATPPKPAESPTTSRDVICGLGFLATLAALFFAMGFFAARITF